MYRIKIKRGMMRLCLILEMVAFCYVYVYGKNGIQSVYRNNEVVAEMEKNIIQISQEIALLEDETHVWKHDDFYKEKVAREQLQMARKGDELFYVGT